MSALERLRAAAPDGPWREAKGDATIPCVEADRDDLLALATTLKEDCDFEQSTLVTAIDHHPASPRFLMVYQFLSYAHGDRIRVQVPLEEGDAKVPSVTGLWPGASFSERECFDMFGIEFAGHPDLRRLLMPEGYGHHPLRKDFPHQGIEPDRLYAEWDRSRREGR